MGRQKDGSQTTRPRQTMSLRFVVGCLVFSEFGLGTSFWDEQAQSRISKRPLLSPSCPHLYSLLHLFMAEGYITNHDDWSVCTAESSINHSSMIFLYVLCSGGSAVCKKLQLILWPTCFILRFRLNDKSIYILAIALFYSKWLTQWTGRIPCKDRE